MVVSPLKSKKNKNKNIPGARDTYMSRAPSLVVVVMAEGCYSDTGAGAAAAAVAAGRGGCGHILLHRDGSVGGVGDGRRSWWTWWTHLVMLCIKKDSLRAQTMHDMLFGPVFSISALPVAYFIHIQPNI